MTYRVNGRQYVVIAAGGGGKLRTKAGDAFVAFRCRSEPTCENSLESRIGSRGGTRCGWA